MLEEKFGDVLVAGWRQSEKLDLEWPSTGGGGSTDDADDIEEGALVMCLCTSLYICIDLSVHYGKALNLKLSRCHCDSF